MGGRALATRFAEAGSGVPDDHQFEITEVVSSGRLFEQ
jgi:hypothetical protein